MTAADDVVSHLDTNWNADTGNNPEPTLDNVIDKSSNDWRMLKKGDVVIVTEDNQINRIGGWAHRDESIPVNLKVRIRTVAGSTTTFKAHLEQVMDEIEHVMHHSNHAMSGYTFHLVSRRRDASDKDRIDAPLGEGEAFGLMTATLYKTGVSV